MPVDKSVSKQRARHPFDLIRVDVNLFESEQARNLRVLLMMNHAEVYPIRIWGYAYRYLPGGVFRSRKDGEDGRKDVTSWIEHVAGWGHGTPGKTRGKLVRSLIETSFLLDLAPNEIAINDWMLISGGYADKLPKARRERYIAEREAQKEDLILEELKTKRANRRTRQAIIDQQEEIFLSGGQIAHDPNDDPPDWIKHMDQYDSPPEVSRDGRKKEK